MVAEPVALARGLAQLTPSQRFLYDELARAEGWVTSGRLERCLWPELPGAPDALRQLVWRTRRKLRGTPYAIEAAPGTGAYRLVEGVA